MPLILYITCSCIFHAYIPSFLYILILNCLVLFCLSFSLSLSFVSYSMAPKRKSTPSWNPLRSEASSSSSSSISTPSQNLLSFGASSSSNPTPSYVRFHDEKAKLNFSENFCRRGIHAKRHVVLLDFSDTGLPTVIHNRGWGSLCGIPVTCPSVIIQEFYFNMHKIDTSVPHCFSRVRDMCIIVTPEIVSEVLHAPRVAHLDYSSYECLRTVSKDELSSCFYETPLSWGNRQNTSCSGLAKGLRFLNMVMTFVLHQLSHYNSITKPRA